MLRCPGHLDSSDKKMRTDVISCTDFSREQGVYALIIELHQKFRFSLRARGTQELRKGRYFYGGSARGPGGLRARIGRHLRANKRIHWHVDVLTNTGRIVCVWSSTDGEECELIRRVLSLAGSTVPIRGLGSSDCNTCPAHLVRLPDGLKDKIVLRRLGGGMVRQVAEV